MSYGYKDALKSADPSWKLYDMLAARTVLAFKKDIITGSASGQTIVDSVPVDCEVIDVIVQPRGASTNGTMKVTDGTDDISDAITCASDEAIGRAGTIDDSKSSLSAGDTLEVVCAGDTVADTKGLITVIAIAD